jgi:hypothetical protein
MSFYCIFNTDALYGDNEFKVHRISIFSEEERMRKAGLIVGGVALVLGLGAALLSPICVPCLSVFLGLLSGYLAGSFDKAFDQRQTVKSGTLGGLLAGIGLLAGQIIGAVINVTVIGPMGTARILYQMGIPAGSPERIAEIYWPTVIIFTTCLTIFDLALMAGMGLLGGLLWWQVSGKNRENNQLIIP